MTSPLERAARYKADGMVIFGGFRDGLFRIGIGPVADDWSNTLQSLGEGPSLVEALDDALQNAIRVEEDMREQGAL